MVEYWYVKILKYWDDKILEYWDVGLLQFGVIGCQYTGILACRKLRFRNTGKLEFWYIRILGCWKIACMEYWGLENQNNEMIFYARDEMNPNIGYQNSGIFGCWNIRDLEC